MAEHMEKEKADRAESEQALKKEQARAVREKYDEKNKKEMKTNRKYNEEICSTLIKEAEEDVKKIKLMAEQFAQEFTLDDFIQDEEGNYSDTVEPIFESVDVYNLPLNQKVTASKIYTQLRASWKLKFTSTKKKFVMNPFLKRARSVDSEVKLSPATQKSKKDEAQTTTTA